MKKCLLMLQLKNTTWRWKPAALCRGQYSAGPSCLSVPTHNLLFSEMFIYQRVYLGDSWFIIACTCSVEMQQMEKKTQFYDDLECNYMEY